MDPEQINLSSLGSARAVVMFNYSTDRLLKKDKIRFFYALNGRDGKSGLLKIYSAVHFGIGVLLVPVKFDKDFQEFFGLWNIPFTRIEMLVEG
ncbi:hypothetical protein J4209_04855 [Candidatus Woesearchaeota archaeon]|nr:hypothetical protein [Candidatus Woesearchaeota archaeon]